MGMSNVRTRTPSHMRKRTLLYKRNRATERPPDNARPQFQKSPPRHRIPRSRQPPYLKESADIQTPSERLEQRVVLEQGAGPSERVLGRRVPTAAEKPFLEIPGSRLSSSGVDAVMKSDRSSSSSAPKNANFVIKTVQKKKKKKKKKS